MVHTFEWFKNTQDFFSLLQRIRFDLFYFEKRNIVKSKTLNV
jgi:hypothetical protein